MPNKNNRFYFYFPIHTQPVKYQLRKFRIQKVIGMSVRIDRSAFPPPMFSEILSLQNGKKYFPVFFYLSSLIKTLTEVEVIKWDWNDWIKNVYV